MYIDLKNEMTLTYLKRHFSLKIKMKFFKNDI